jgi:hypothetical protein
MTDDRNVERLDLTAVRRLATVDREAELAADRAFMAVGDADGLARSNLTKNAAGWSAARIVWRTAYRTLADELERERFDFERTLVRFDEAERALKTERAANAKLREAAWEVDSHSEGCSAIHGPPGETWTDERDCNCPLRDLRAALRDTTPREEPHD